MVISGSSGNSYLCSCWQWERLVRPSHPPFPPSHCFSLHRSSYSHYASPGINLVQYLVKPPNKAALVTGENNAINKQLILSSIIILYIFQTFLTFNNIYNYQIICTLTNTLFLPSFSLSRQVPSVSPQLWDSLVSSPPSFCVRAPLRSSTLGVDMFKEEVQEALKGDLKFSKLN